VFFISDIHVPSLPYHAFQSNIVGTSLSNIITTFGVLSVRLVGSFHELPLSIFTGIILWGSFAPFHTKLSEPESAFGLHLWWNPVARRQGAHHKHCTAPLAVSNRTCYNKRFWFEEHRKRVRGCDTTYQWETTQLRKSMKTWNDYMRLKAGKHIVCILFYDEVRWCLSILGPLKYILPIVQSTSITHFSMCSSQSLSLSPWFVHLCMPPTRFTLPKRMAMALSN